MAKRRRDHGLFVAFAPAEDPKIVVAVIVENGQHGSWVAAIARKVMDAYLLDQGELYKEYPPAAEQAAVEAISDATKLSANMTATGVMP